MPNITQFKSALAEGGARPNQFRLSIPFPSDVKDANQTDLLLVSGAALPASTVNPVITQYRGREVKLAGERIFDPWTITIANDTAQSLRQPFEEWLDGMNNRGDNSAIALRPSDYQTDITVTHLDRNDNALPGGIITLQDAFPINMSEIALQYAQNDIIEEFTVTFQYQTYTAQ